MVARLQSAVRSSAVLDWLAAALTVLGTARAVVNPDLPTPSLFVVGATVIAIAALIWRRSHPELVLGVELAAAAVGVVPIPAMLALGTVAARLGWTRRVQLWAAASFAAALILLAQFVDAPDIGTGRALGFLYATGLTVVVPLLLGLYIHSRAEILESAQAREAELLTAADADAERARIGERARIAREMHDVVAHRVSLISLHAGALELSEEGTPAGDAAVVIREAAHQALEELRQVVGVLRTNPDGTQGEPLTPQPTLRDVKTLVEDWQAAGAVIQFHDELDAHARDDVSPSCGRTIYRLIQEALTNASKHAPGGPVDVTLTLAADTVSVSVVNSSGIRESSRARTGAGVGLYGLRERVEVAGGRFEAGSLPDGGFAVRATLPVSRAQ
jgi:signal transduction histidine kinase